MLKDILKARGKKRIGLTDNREILDDLAVFPCIKLTERPITSTDLPTIEMIYRGHCFQKANIKKHTLMPPGNKVQRPEKRDHQVQE